MGKFSPARRVWTPQQAVGGDVAVAEQIVFTAMAGGSHGVRSSSVSR
ncbi:hypothetical protein PH213_03910 [Streptomyces sp. SRF1]|nr:hypothetical protein [Streptomyces sp. SRF1]MDN3053701.1 hypothetical protein [Streptomyces sp. SRF1]